MKLEQSSVRHIRYGVGTVLHCEDAMITVEFAEIGQKQFVYPDAFERFLKAEDPECAAEIAEQIILKKAEMDAQHREQEAMYKAIADAKAASKPAKTRKTTTRAKKI